jgi:hypothetical protein
MTVPLVFDDLTYISIADAVAGSKLSSEYLARLARTGRLRGRIDVETLANWRSNRQGPPYHRFGGRVILYRADVLERWKQKNLVPCDPVNATNGDDHSV